MKKISLLVFLLSAPLMGQWVPGFESYHGGVCSLGEGGSQVFAGAKGGAIFSSADYGNTWNLITVGEIKNDVISITADDSMEFAGTNGGGIFCRGTHGGAWRRLNNGLSDTIVNAIVIRGRGNIIAGTEHGVFVSSDYGTHWSSRVSAFSEYPALALTQNDSGIFAGTTQGIIYFSSDSGETWVERGSILNHKIVTLAIFGKKVLAGTADSGIFISTNYGFSWIQANTGLLNLNIAGLASTDSKIYAASWMGSGGGFVSADSGNTWKPLLSLTDSILTAVMAIGDNVFVSSFTVFSGVFQSSDDGASWTQANLGGKTNYRILGFTRSGSNIFAATGGGGVLRTTDLGKTWASVNSGLTELFINSIVAKDSILLVGTYMPAISRSTNSGDSWSVVYYSGGPCSNFVFHDSTIYAANGTDVFFSTDDGLNWNAAGLGQMGNIGQTVNAVALMDSTLFASAAIGTYVTASDGALFRTTNNGAKWVACGLNNLVVTMAVKDSILFIGTINGLYKTLDHGVTCISAGLNSNYILSLVPYKNYLFACTNQGLYVSSDNGDTWANKSEGLNDVVDAIFIIDSTVYAGPGDGVWTRKLSEIITGVENRVTQIPSHFVLEQNYPNPFNPATVISYQLPTNTLVTLKVYDELGRIVRTLVEDRQTAGTHSVTFNASNLSSGVYFYRLTAGSIVQTKKLMLIK